MKKCSPKAGGFSETRCDALVENSKHSIRNSVGLMLSEVVEIDSGASKGKRVSLRKHQYDDIVTVNYCPFCGNPVRDFSKD